MKKRSVSLKIRAMGIFPGATVQRGKDWSWGDQDGWFKFLCNVADY